MRLEQQERPRHKVWVRGAPGPTKRDIGLVDQFGKLMFSVALGAGDICGARRCQGGRDGDSVLKVAARSFCGHRFEDQLLVAIRFVQRGSRSTGVETISFI